jgi:Fic family protein
MRIIKATDYAINRLKELPLCNRLIKEAHEVLLSGARGQNKSPGEFRHSQNWIGAAGCNLQNARYIPPNVEDMKQTMSDLEKYINGDDELDVLIRAALIHYQFETIHPFLDGNGRIGRLLITLFLMEKKVLSTPALYISYFLKKNRIEYYDRMNEVRLKGNYEQWIKFFLEAIIETSKTAKEKFRKVVELTMEMDRLIMELPVKPENAKKVIDVLYDEPVINRKKLSDLTGIKEGTIKNIINCLLENDIIVETTGYSRNQIFTFQKYTDLFLK